MAEVKQRLLGMTLAELKEAVLALGMPGFTAKQIAQWLYEKHVQSVDEMTNISKQNRQRLAEEYEVGLMPAIDSQHSKDGTIKYLFPVENNHFVETVYIPDGERATLCVSCQVGCKMNCLFCQTGKQGWQGNLTPADILNQIYVVNHHSPLTNIVFMGQGEPMDNLDAVLKATEILTADWGFAWSPKRITVSSVGVPETKAFPRRESVSRCHLHAFAHS